MQFCNPIAKLHKMILSIDKQWFIVQFLVYYRFLQNENIHKVHNFVVHKVVYFDCDSFPMN